MALDSPHGSIARVDNRGDVVQLTWADGNRARFHAPWLRDNCSCVACRHPDNDQRLFDITSVEDAISITTATVGEDGALHVRFGPDGHEGHFAPGWLRENRYDGAVRGLRGSGPRHWGRELTDALPTAVYRDVIEHPTALARWLGGVRDYGVALLTGLPQQNGMVARVAELFGQVRETNYGRWFDVESVPSPINLAYTALPLGVHTDNPYREPVPGLQLLHCLESSATGGETILVDGFRAAAALRAAAPQHFELLARHPVTFRFRDRHTALEARAPLISVDGDGAISALRHNTRSMAPLDLPAEHMAAYYEAYRRFARLLNDPEVQVRIALSPGDLFMVDNHRVLHGRTGFAVGGRRHLQGCYADWDGLDSFLRLHAAD